MNIILTLICVFVLTPVLSYGAEMREIHIKDNGFQFSDPVLQNKFMNALERDGVVFQQRKDGMVIYSPTDEKKVKRVQMEILETSLTPSTRFEDEQLQIQFMKQLASQGVRFSIEIRDGNKWIAWSEKDDSVVRKISDEILDKAIKDILDSRKRKE